MLFAPVRPLRLVVVLASLTIAGLTASPAGAQYFGRNKVQFRTFDFQILKTAHFDVYYYTEERQAAEIAGRMAERWYARYARRLEHRLDRRQPLILYASHPHFEQTNAIPGDLSEGTGGVTEALKRRIVLPLAGPLSETDHVIGHELVHAFQYDMTGQRSSESGFAVPTALRLPLWFIEGQAEYFSLGPLDPHTAMWIRDAAQSNRLPTIHKLENPRYFPYRYGQALWAYVAGRWGDSKIAEILSAAGRTGDADQAFVGALGISTDSLSREWHRAIKSWYAAIASVTEKPDSSARPLVLAKKVGNQLNLAPALSPDGTRMVFLSEKDQLSIEMYLADAHTGRILRRLTKTATDPHYQSLQFIQSSGAWSPDGKRFAFAAVVKGKPVLSILDGATGKRLSEIPFPELGEIFTPTWAPDGHRVAFSAMVGGLTDLYWADLQTSTLHRLTNDVFGEIHPAWSPDGKSIAFSTDRYGTEIDSLRFGSYRLAAIDMDTGEERELPGFPKGKHINPQWSRDGSSLYFISDRNGVSNIYRLEVASGALTQVTNVRTGVSGITNLSPAFSLARDVDRLVFSAYEADNYDLYSIDSPAILAGVEPRPEVPGVDPGLIPGGVGPVAVAEVPADTLGPAFPSAASFHTVPYRSRLSLDYVSQPALAVGAGPSGFAVGGGATLAWSDMLGNHNLITLLQVDQSGGSFFNGLGLAGQYDNRKSRWNWGGFVGQIPVISRDFILDEVPYNGETSLRERDVTFWEIHRELAGQVSYPFSRVHRMEMWGGFRNISFKSRVRTRIYSEATNNLLADFNENIPFDNTSALNLGMAGAALVYDTSVFGGTSPVIGQSYRLEGDGSFGDLNYVTALADYRRYFFIARPVSFAGRILHVGRYGADGESPRLTSMFLGYPWLMRGYDDGSFSANECVDNGDGTMTCPVFNQLFGSRLAVANFELRVPILGALGLLRSPGVPPVEAAAFFDAGVAWTKSDKAWFLGGNRDPVTSYGGSFRVNLLGFAVAEIALVHPNDRPRKSWYWEFNLSPGF